MHVNAMPSKASSQNVRDRQHRPASYQRVCDARKHPVRGLWKRNARYYAQITIEDPDTGKKKVQQIPLEGAATDTQAITQFHELKGQRRKGSLPVLRMAPKFSDYADHYLAFYKAAKDTKRESTMETEGYAIDRWKEHLDVSSSVGSPAAQRCVWGSARRSLDCSPGAATDLRILCTGWHGGVVPADELFTPPKGADFATGGVLAGALGVAKSFLRASDICIRAAHFASGASVWNRCPAGLMPRRRT